jgi:hypothetical protein
MTYCIEMPDPLRNRLLLCKSSTFSALSQITWPERIGVTNGEKKLRAVRAAARATKRLPGYEYEWIEKRRGIVIISYIYKV